MKILSTNNNLFYGLWQLFMIRKIDSSTCQMNSHLLQHGFNVALLLIAACGGGGERRGGVLLRGVVGMQARRRQQPDDSGQFLPLFFACDDEFSAGSRYS